jgi:hypothetical protein
MVAIVAGVLLLTAVVVVLVAVGAYWLPTGQEAASSPGQEARQAAGTAPGALSPPSSGERFPLNYELAQDDGDPLVLSAHRFVQPLGGNPASWLKRSFIFMLKSVPKDFVSGGKYFQVRLGRDNVLFALDGAKPAKLYVDTNRDGRLSDEKPFETASLKKGHRFEGITGVHVFGPVSVAAGEKGAQMRLNIVAFGASGLYVFPAGYMSGRVRLDGQDYRVAVVDGNFDGRYSEALTLAAPEGEGVGYDNFAFGPDAKKAFLQEVQPLPKMISVDKAWYAVAVAPDGSSIVMAKVEPKMGTLDIGKVDADLTLWSESGIQRLKGDEGTWQLPVGKYGIKNITLRRTDKGNKWSIMGFTAGKGVMIEIAANQSTMLKLGPPLLVKTEMKVADGTASFNLSLVGQGGEEYAAMVLRNGQLLREAPKFIIYNELGKEIASGSFQYG